MIILYAVTALAASAQNVRKAMTLQDLVGEWELTSEDSSFPTGKSRGTEMIRIALKDNEVTIFRKFEDAEGFRESTSVYFADGRGETNRQTFDIGIVIEEKTKSAWKNGVLSSKGSYKITPLVRGFGILDGSTAIEGRYRLSKDFLKLEYEEIQQRPGPRPPPSDRAFTTRKIYRRL
jgi:hypothetical protein